MNIVQALIKVKNEILSFVTTNLNNKADVDHKHDIDAVLNAESTNPVQNKVISMEVNTLHDLVGDLPVSEQINNSITSQLNNIVEQLNKKITVDLLWTNPYGPGSYEFSAQNLSLSSVSNYDYFLIIYSVYNGILKSVITPYYDCVLDFADRYNYTRFVAFVDDGVEFEDCTYRPTYGGNNSMVDNAKCVPVQIFGLDLSGAHI